MSGYLFLLIGNLAPLADLFAGTCWTTFSMLKFSIETDVVRPTAYNRRFELA